MDIDSPPIDASLPTDALSAFGLRYPLPFRILFLSSLTVLGFASNLHILSHLGIDTALVLDVRLDAPPSTLPRTVPLSSLSNTAPSSTAHPPYVHPSKLYPPLYSLAVAGLGWTAAGWLFFRLLTGGDPAAGERWRIEPAALLILAAAAICWPGNALCRRERFRFLRSIRRIVSPSLNAAVPFSDIILADILTSSAKVLGDVWVAGCILFEGGAVGTAGLSVGDACKRVWGVPFMTSLPYLFRFRQCLSEVYTRSTPTPRRSLLNALKYATAFPVIIFSAMQTVIGDPFDPDEEAHEAGERWIGRTTLFNLWILAVLVNSLYSFWWDVTNDWGLSLLTKSGWSSSPSVSYAFINPPSSSGSHAPHRSPASRGLAGSHQHHRARSNTPNGLLGPPSLANGEDGSSLSTTFPPPPSRPQSPLPKPGPASATLAVPSTSGSPGSRRTHHMRAFSTASSPNLSYPFLRPILLLPDPLIYYLFILLDLLLRLTWSLKLSSHLHSVQEVEAGVFVVELMEVVRRWMWCYLRIEWEAVRKGAGSEVVSHHAPSAPGGVSWLEKDEGEARLRMQEEYELALRGSGGAGPSGPGGVTAPLLEDVKGAGGAREGELV
ncbi:RHTO0S24e00188g1_1 [Rhodotorula toruloides]|uniref:RHTO0S24e00188g1_1 n=2 Tax=Rhodotorula toruloides TaxID=5286 RepID=A0A061BMH5_RHOTO|nr:protein-ER retention-related protein [Rhodotorula toruloides NP11]EMS19367.1 protein-ER retention-related protein [Rhodotorula toruloides NP11]CDR49183.1 RHTO0S24e00188g1_1 [Rhodotorula toruloides]